MDSYPLQTNCDASYGLEAKFYEKGEHIDWYLLNEMK